MKVLFVLSSPHGGSTLISHMLGLQAQATHLGELTFLNKLIALDESCTCGEKLLSCSMWQEIFSRFGDLTGLHLTNNPYAAFFGDAVKPKLGSGLVDHNHQHLPRRVVAKLRGAYDTAILMGLNNNKLLTSLTLPSVREAVRNRLALYQAAADTHATQWVVDASKTPKMAPHLYIEKPDEVRVLHLSRDARSVCASRLAYMPMDKAAERWNHYHSLTLSLLQRWVAPQHRQFLRYEDFMHNPSAHLASLCDWLEMPYDEALVDVGALSHAAGGNTARFSFKQGLKPAEEKWRKQFGQAELRSYQRYAQKLNRQLGYV